MSILHRGRPRGNYPQEKADFHLKLETECGWAIKVVRYFHVHKDSARSEWLNFGGKPASWVCNLCAVAQGSTFQKSHAWLILCCPFLEILNNIKQAMPHFQLALSTTNHTASPVCTRGEMGTWLKQKQSKSNGD